MHIHSILTKQIIRIASLRKGAAIKLYPFSVATQLAGLYGPQFDFIMGRLIIRRKMGECIVNE